MRLSTFVKLATTIACNARHYRNKRACELALARVKRAYEASGSYGCYAGERRAAIDALQDRWVELDCDEREARALAKEGQS